MPRPVHFEIHADDPDRAQSFYERVFGWKIDRWGEQEYWLITTGPDEEPGINGGMVLRRGLSPAADAPVSAFVVTVDVPDVDAALEAVDGAGGTRTLPKQALPGMGWVAYCKDTEGNLVGLWQTDESAT